MFKSEWHGGVCVLVGIRSVWYWWWIWEEIESDGPYSCKYSWDYCLNSCQYVLLIWHKSIICSMYRKQMERYHLKKKRFQIMIDFGIGMCYYMLHPCMCSVMYIQTIIVCFRLEMFDFAEVRVPGDGNCQVNFYFISISRIILGELD